MGFPFSLSKREKRKNADLWRSGGGREGSVWRKSDVPRKNLNACWRNAQSGGNDREALRRESASGTANARYRMVVGESSVPWKVVVSGDSLLKLFSPGNG